MQHCLMSKGYCIPLWRTFPGTVLRMHSSVKILEIFWAKSWVQRFLRRLFTDLKAHILECLIATTTNSFIFGRNAEKLSKSRQKIEPVGSPTVGDHSDVHVQLTSGVEQNKVRRQRFVTSALACKKGNAPIKGKEKCFSGFLRTVIESRKLRSISVKCT